MGNTRSLIAYSTVLYGLGTLFLQLLGVFSLDAADYGIFSALYLGFALTSALLQSVLLDAWSIEGLRHRALDEWPTFSNVLLQFASGSLVFGIGLSLLVARTSTVAVLLGSGAIALATYRTGFRFFHARRGEWFLVIVSDSLSLLGTIGGWFMSHHIGLAGYEVVLFAWVFGLTLSLTRTRLPALRGPGVVGWVRGHRRDVAPLLGDTVLMEGSAVGTPYILAVVMSMSEFGVYRAVSTVSSPIRLLFAAVKPALASGNGSRFWGWRFNAVVGSVSVITGVLVHVALSGLPRLQISLGVASDLVPYSEAVGVYACGSILLQYYYLLCRSRGVYRAVVAVRPLQTAVGVGCPIGGFAVGGLAGAIWGFSAATVIAGLAWMIAGLRWGVKM